MTASWLTFALLLGTFGAGKSCILPPYLICLHTDMHAYWFQTSDVAQRCILSGLQIRFSCLVHVSAFSVQGFIEQFTFVPNVPLRYNPLMSLSVYKSVIKRDTERINELLNLVSAECDKVNEPVCLGLCVCACRNRLTINRPSITDHVGLCIFFI